MEYSMRVLELRLEASWFIQRTIDRLEAAECKQQAQCLESDFSRALRLLPELLMVRDNAERLADWLDAQEINA
jgi:hypothetical protein